MGEIMGIVSAVVLLAQGDPAVVAKDLAALGFATTPVAPRGVVITGDERLFEDRFDVTLEVDETGVWAVIDGERSRALPETELPADLQAQIEAIEFESPPTFGPSDY